VTNPIKGIKDEIEQLKRNIDGIKGDVQSTVSEVKDTVSDAKDTFSSWKHKEGEPEGVIVKETNAFVIHMDGGQVGEITYAPSGEDAWVVNHTYVSPAYRGRDIARRLLDQVVEEARAQNKRIIPLCSYAAVQFRRNPNYSDVWQQS